MTNPSRCSIDTNLFHSRARAPHAILRPLLLAAATPIATAQMTTESSSSSDLAYSNINPLVTSIIAIIVFAFFFFMAFLSLYIRFCADESENTRRTTAAPPQQTRRGLDPEVIDSFPIFQYSEVIALRIGKGGALECAVCLAEFEDDDTLRLLPKCDHVFHPECIDAWLASHSSCPICRANLTPSQYELVEALESTHLNNSEGLVEAQNQIQIDIDERPTEEVQVSEMPKRNQRGGGKFSRSHSTGHSLIQPGENLERYTLRLPAEVMRQMMSQRLKRTISCVVVLPREGSSRRGEGSSRWRHVGRSDREGRSDRWVFSMTPPFLSRVRLPTSPKLGFERDSTAVGGSKSFLKTPFDCLAVKIDGVEQTSICPPV